MKASDDKLELTVPNAPRPERIPGQWHKFFEQISAGRNQLPLVSRVRPSGFEPWWRALATVALVGAGGIALVIQLEAAEAPTSVAAESRTNRAPALSPGSSKAVSGQDRQTLLTEGSNMSAVQVRVIEEDPLEKAVALEPRSPSRSLELGERHLEKAQPRFDNPNGDIAAARQALVCLPGHWSYPLPY